jgi:dihydrofolate reductase
MSITMIAAMARNRVIGAHNDLPWNLPDDMAFFIRSTTGLTVLMGRKTLESFHGPLKNRTNVVLTRDRNYHPEGCIIVHSVEEALERFENDDLMVVGGAEIYKQMLPYADTILLTEVEAEVEGDALFPEFEGEEWTLEDSEFHPADERHAYEFRFQTYRRKDAEA